MGQNLWGGVDMKEETLIDKKVFIKDAKKWVYPEKDVKEFIQDLKEEKECFICGKHLPTGEGHPNKSQLCGICLSYIRTNHYFQIKKRLLARIEKLAGKGLI